MSLKSMVPPLEKCWSVTREFMRFMPGLASYKLGKVARILNPDDPNLNNLHRARPDSEVLYKMLGSWVELHGRVTELESED
ncbi:uncharacterized protein PV06_02768 [Exophiala oligosperma]|uniref:Uncharacterized protein n=1 Tax=Exophiala oligosperma TaxID=215243 RepID=A0A0D2DWZ9_9EURO|nr:uncharacterized protein PV06_02768 [Exophiala oligosperma]KIW47170.1 hypothetical protein PV06_02768 [Exophiala oligosperma]